MKNLVNLALKFVSLVALLWVRMGVSLQTEYIRQNSKEFGSLRLNGWGVFSGVSMLTIGANVHVGKGARWYCEGGIEVGDNTHISRFVKIYSRSHNYSGRRIPYDETYILKKVVIEKNVWIGSDVIILPGTVIGEGAIIGAGSIVTGSVPPCAIWGMKGQVIGMRDEEHYEECVVTQSIGGANGKKI